MLEVSRREEELIFGMDFEKWIVFNRRGNLEGRARQRKENNQTLSAYWLPDSAPIIMIQFLQPSCEISGVTVILKIMTVAVDLKVNDRNKKWYK